MTSRILAFQPAARADLGRAWSLVAQNDGEERTHALFARLEAFCLSLAEFAEIGTRHDDHYQGLRSVGVPGLTTVTVLFLVRPDTVSAKASGMSFHSRRQRALGLQRVCDFVHRSLQEASIAGIHVHDRIEL
jgi:plasmid stabilization system protein ParE